MRLLGVTSIKDDEEYNVILNLDEIKIVTVIDDKDHRYMEYIIKNEIRAVKVKDSLASIAEKLMGIE